MYMKGKDEGVTKGKPPEALSLPPFLLFFLFVLVTESEDIEKVKLDGYYER